MQVLGLQCLIPAGKHGNRTVINPKEFVTNSNIPDGGGAVDL